MKKLNLGIKKCLQCGKKIELKIRRDLHRKKFCSKKCSSKYNDSFKGIWDNPEIAERMKKNMRKPHRVTDLLLKAAKERGLKRLGTKISGRYIICQQCRKRVWAFKCRINEKVAKNGQLQLKKFCSNKCRTLFSRKSDELKCDKVRLKEWSLKVLKRDKYICQNCGCKRKRLLMAHHIKPKEKFLDLWYNLENGMTLCIYCHIKKHPELEKFMLSSLKIRLNKPYVSGSIS